jgi:RES domain-containing protein
MLGSAPPELANERGARWNPPGTSALNTSLAETTAKAEGDHVIAMQPVPPRAARTIYELDISIENLLVLTDVGRLAAIGVTEEDFHRGRLGA